MEQDARLLELTADIVAAHVASNNVAAGEVAGLIGQVHEALAKAATVAEPEKPEAKPAVSVRSSVKPDHLVCLVCGSRQKTLRRHIAVAHGLMPDEYRARFDLPRTYPMVAADYTDRRREIALALGLGRKRTRKPAAAKEAEEPKPRRGRRRS
jgi:predicted transcriptional regulator